MPRAPRKGMVYFGLDLPEHDLAIVREVAKADDRSAGYIIRKAVAAWIASDAKLAKMKAALVTEAAKNAVRPAKKAKVAGKA